MKISKLTNLVLVAAACGAPAFSAKLIVNNVNDVPSCPAEYATIQDAVNAANPGDTVYVCASTYNEQVTISKNITLAGQTGATIMPSAVVANTTELYSFPGTNPLLAAAIVLVQNASNVIVSGLIVDGTNNGLNGGCGTDILGIYYQNAGGTINHNAIRYIELGPTLFGCQVGLGILAESNDGASKSVSITQNSIHDYQKDGIDIDTPTYGFAFQHNAVTGVGPTPVIGQNGIEIDAAATSSSILGNTVTANSYICPPLPATCYSATDILDYGTNNVSVTQNTVLGSNVGIYYFGDNATISSNSVANMTGFDGIYLQDSVADAGSVISKNAVTNSPYAIELDGSSSNVKITSNSIVEAAVGVSNDNASQITTTGNTYFDVVLPVQNSLPPAGAASVRKVPNLSRAR